MNVVVGADPFAALPDRHLGQERGHRARLRFAKRSRRARGGQALRQILPGTRRPAARLRRRCVRAPAAGKDALRLRIMARLCRFRLAGTFLLAERGEGKERVIAATRLGAAFRCDRNASYDKRDSCPAADRCLATAAQHDEPACVAGIPMAVRYDTQRVRALQAFFCTLRQDLNIRRDPLPCAEGNVIGREERS